jgi:hypothetical protein
LVGTVCWVIAALLPVFVRLRVLALLGFAAYQPADLETADGESRHNTQAQVRRYAPWPQTCGADGLAGTTHRNLIRSRRRDAC